MIIDLIKYDLKYIFKTVMVFAILLLLSAILHNVTSYGYTPTILDANGNVTGGDPDAPTIILFLHTLFYNAIYCFATGLLVNSCMRVWQRFKSSMYGDEAYLTHTLPLSRSTLWASKFLSILITAFSTVLILALTCFILNLTDGGKYLIGGIGISSDWPLNNLVYASIVFTQLIFIMMSGVSGIILANRIKSCKPHPILYGFGFYILGSCLILVVSQLLQYINPDFQALFGHTFDPYSTYTVSFITSILTTISLFYTAIIAALYIIDRKLLRRGINLD